MAEKEIKYTFWLIFSVFMCAFGNSFLYGYQIGVINTPSKGGKGVPVIIPSECQSVLAFLVDPRVRNEAGIHEENKYVFAASRGLAVVRGYESLSHVCRRAGLTRPEKVTSVTLRKYMATVTQIIIAYYNEIYTARQGDAMAPNLISLLWSFTVAIFVAFGFIGAFMSGKIADYFGRKRSMLLITILMLLAAVTGGITKVTKAPELLIISRALVGLHCGINVSVASLYLAEISPRKIRGAIGTCHQLAITVGILVSQIMGLPELLGTVELWPILFALNAVPTIVSMIGFPFCPESPRFLFKQRKETEAREALCKLRGYSDVEDEMEEMKKEMKATVSDEAFTLKKLLTTPDLRIPIIIACILQASQQWSGINAVFSYSSFIMDKADVKADMVPYAIVGTGTINVIATIICVPLMEKLGRRPLLLWPMGLMMVSMVTLTIFLNLQEQPKFADEDWMAYINIICMHTYIVGFALGLGPIPFLIVSEMFRQAPRSTAMSFSLVFNWVCNFILMMSYPFLQDLLGAYTFVVFMVIVTACIVFIYFFVPETKNRTFEEIAQSVSFGRSKKRSLALQEDVDESTPMDTKI